MNLGRFEGGRFASSRLFTPLYRETGSPLEQVIPPGPVMDSVTAVATGDTTAQLDIDASPIGATVYWYISSSATAPSATDLKSGTGAADSGSYTVASVPQLTTGPSGLTASTDYFVYALSSHGGEDSAIASDSFATGAVDVTAPRLSGAAATVLDTTSADVGVTTDEDRGTLYWYVSTSATPPSAADLKAGTGSVAAGTLTVNTNETDISIPVNGLTEAAHYGYFLQSDPSGNESAIAATGSFTPANVTAPVVSSVELVATDTATLTFNTDTAGGVAYFIVQPTADAAPNLAQVKAGSVGSVQGQQVVSTTGPQNINITGLTGSVGYLAYVVHTDSAGNNSTVEVASAEAVPTSDIGEAFSVTGGENRMTINSITTVAAPTAVGGALEIVISS